ncbi:MAG: 23S rRNA pseudouridine1911/1915/1917 synthase [Zhongshania aliphaticivorans]|jgi:23S rRNA pseudouridine1911/1915/1917 synthase|uniref:Pseudouridine synthase n=1 Tax=Zhongshania aliphaticivorans TaxID=1470434 RepID=A0A127M7Z9_9GAMM|nr:23S rRNA pseudouridine(1911/1915/1917) synthase RluD [Zhongshania aliphaticivorans]AMO69374.1 RNA pseudouridine synthase [Zhongshania aliphaticivorans]EIF42465.1 pseudouridine synthase [gamma proteobacterium BDW918]|tara:strand:+ start:90009 stop:90965 length:957 start_codon:yes stop_codon:yes gene_type:complete
MTEIIERQEIVPAGFNGDRFDQVAAQLFPEYSRSRLQTWIKSGELTVNGEVQRTRDKVYEDDKLALHAELQSEVRWEAEKIELDIVYEDDHVMVINKPSGLVVHPGAGNPDGTLLNALLNHFPDIATVPRAGIVHRLDRDTTGLMIAAKTLEAHTSLVAQLQAREVHREYDAVVFGTMTGGGTVDEPMGRHPRQRTKMAVSQIGGKEAITHYRVTRRFLNHTHIRCFLETGRTHQIRVHMAHIKYPLIGDPLYAGRPRLPKGASEVLITQLRGFGRQALHARRLELEHPISGDTMSWEVPLPEDMKALLAVLSTEDVR